MSPSPRLRSAVTAVSAVLLLVLTGCTSSDAPDRPIVVDLVQQDWQHVPGVARDGDELRVESTGRRIVQQDGSGGQDDPPVDLAGTHLSVDGDVTVRVSFADVTDDATLAVSDTPPVVADEFRIEPSGVRLTLRGDDLRIAEYEDAREQVAEDDAADGDDTAGSLVTDPQPVRDEHVHLDDPGATLALDRYSDRLTVRSGGDTVATLPLGDVLGSGALWFGLSSEHGSFTVPELTASAPADASLSAEGPAVDDAERDDDGDGDRDAGLQALAARSRPDFRIGAAIALGPLAADPGYADAVVRDFGAITPENAMKAQALSPRQGEYRFGEADALLDVAERKGLAVHGHTIAFTEAMPRWMRDLPSGTEQERRTSADALLGYLTMVVTHFRGRLDSLDVVNEPFDVDQGTDLQQNTWYRVLGPDYPVVVSRAVHEADPDVRQFVNENGADVPGPRQDALLRLVERTNARGGYLDGVGLQAHVYDLDTDAISADDLTTTLGTFAAAGLLVRISENDVTDAEGQDAQAAQYATVLGTCLRSPACVAYTTWGVDDRYDWWTDDDGGLHQGHDLLFDDGEPTPAYDAARAALTGGGTAGRAVRRGPGRGPHRAATTPSR